MAHVFLIYVIALTTVAQVTARCPAVCECPADPLVCTPGLSTVSDGCGCCKVCAAQLNQDCSSTRPCDHQKGLECNYGNDVTVAWGICRAKSEGRTCEYNGRIYQNGESFRAGCKHQCTCISGAVGCAPLCNNKLPPASPSCPYPRLIRIPGQCCFSVDCHKGTWRLPPKYPVPPLQHQPRSHQQPHPDHHHHKNELGLANKLAGVKSSGWESKHGYKHLPVWSHLRKKCPVQTTDWSQCSRSCGMGISSRLTTKNPQCKLERETRICTMQPCHALTDTAKPQKGKKCSPTQKAPKALRLSYGECESVRLYQPNHCGVCTDGRCCSPHRTRTIPVTFVCPDGKRFQKAAMFIQLCKCSDDCGLHNEVALPP